MENFTISNFTGHNETDSYFNVPKAYQEFLKEFHTTAYVSTIIYSIIAIFGIIGNVFVLFVYSFRKLNDQTGSRYFIPRLAFCDLILCLVFGIFAIIMNNLKVYTSQNMCKFTTFVSTVASNTSNGFLLAIAVQRFLMVCRPFGKQMTLNGRRLTATLIIVSNLLLSVPVLVISGQQGVSVLIGAEQEGELRATKNVVYKTRGCSFTNNLYPRFQVIYTIILTFVMTAYVTATVGVYVPITRIIYRHFSTRRNNRTENMNMTKRGYANNAQERKRKIGTEENINAQDKDINITKDDVIISQIKKDTDLKNENRIQTLVTARTPIKKAKKAVTNFNMMFFTIIFTYVLAYVPTATLFILDSFNHRNDPIHSNLWIYSLSGSYVINNAINPFVYAYFDLQMRQSIHNLIRTIRNLLPECIGAIWYIYTTFHK